MTPHADPKITIHIRRFIAPMVNIVNDTKLFTPKNISMFAKKHAKLLYAILGEAIPNTDHEYSTIGLALTPPDATAMCEEAMGDAIEVWVIDGDRGLLSEKWEPQYFKDHFMEIVEYERPSIPQRHGEDDGEDGEDADDKRHESGGGAGGGMGIEMPPEVVLGRTMLDILECEQMVSKEVATTSYMTGHPIDITKLLNNLHQSISDILKAFASSKGGYEPKLRKKDGMVVPYWTKTQIKQAKIKD